MIAAAIMLIALVTAGVWMLLHHLEPERDSKRRIIRRINDILPQTQCQQCGYQGCLPYAQEIVSAGASIDQCPPGGQGVHRSLAELLGRSGNPLLRVADSTLIKQVVVIDEPVCIGCTKCIQACPVDAIVETRIHEYHMEEPGQNIMTKDKLLAVGDKFDAMISADKAADAKYK